MASPYVRNAVTPHIAAAWPHTPIVGVNGVASPPNDGSGYMLIQFPITGEETIEVGGVPGNRLRRESGGVRIVLCLPIGEGLNDPDAPWLERIEAVRAALRDATFDDARIRLFDPSPATDDDDNDRGAYFVLSFAVEYEADIFA